MATTLAQLRSQSRERADMSNSDFIEDDELDVYINDSYRELYDVLVSKFADYYVSGPTDFSVASGGSTYTLPTDFYKLLGLDRAAGGGDYYTLRPFSFTDRNNRRDRTVMSGGYPDIQYRIVGNVLRFTPEAQAEGDYRIWYVPSVTVLSADSDTLDVQADRWREYITTDVAIKMLSKEESDVQVQLLQKSQLLRRIEEMAANRDAGEPERVTDVTRGGYDDPFYYRW